MAGSVKIVLPEDLSQLTPYVIAEQGDWFEEEIRFARKFLQSGMRVLDIGANYGTYTLVAAKQVGAEGKVWSAEPIPGVNKTLQASIMENGYENISLHQIALSDSDGSATFNVSESSEMSGIIQESDTDQGIKVETMSLDSFAEMEEIQAIDFLKMDAEGVEAAIIQNGQQFLQKESPLVLLEIKKDETYDFRAVEEIEKLGYEAYRLLPEHDLLVAHDRQENLDAFWINLFFCKPDRANQLHEAGFLALREEIDEVPEIDAGLLQEYLKKHPFGLELLNHQTVKLDPVDKEQSSYLLGLNYFVASLDKNRDPKSRYACLLYARQEVMRAIQARITLARGLSLARIEHCLHNRSVATRILTNLVPEILGQKDLPFEEPFISPSNEFESVSPSGDLEKWAIANVIEQKIRIQHFSTIFAVTETAQDFVNLNENGFHTTTIEDRAKTFLSLYGQANK